MGQFFQILSVLRQVSPELRGLLRSTLDQAAADAAKTPGSADDRAVALLKTLAMLAGLY